MYEFDLDHIFRYHEATPEKVDQYQRIRGAAKEFCRVILENSPTCPDQSVAVRLVRDAVMSANAAIALDGRLYVQPQTIDPNAYRKY